MSRNIFTVIEKMIEYIPKDDPSGRAFLDELNDHIDKLLFVPPEKIFDSYQFNRLLPILVKHLGKEPPTYGWKKDVYDVWMDNK